VAVERTDAIIAGVNKAGTTSLFVSLSTHPDVAPSSIKETRYFLPPRYGRALAPASVWDGYFAHAGDRPVHLEATPSYFYGANAVATAMRDRLVNPHVLLVLREPVSRAISFFTYQKVRLRFPAEYPIDAYLAAADRLGPDDFRDPDNERYMAVRGGCYADFLPAWLDTFGTERVHVLDFQRLVSDQAGTLRTAAAALGLDLGRFPADAQSSENRTTGFRSRAFQRIALGGNDKLERVLRRHPDTKRKLRAFYYRLNGQATEESIPEAVRADLAARYVEPNERLARQLDDAGITKPAFLTTTAHDQTS
jgi:Sulfotransferase domain